MSSEDINKGRRRLLTNTVAVVGAAGVAGAAVPFIKMWQPSARALAAGAPVEVNIGKLLPGQRLTTEWRGKPVWIVRRTPEMLQGMAELNDVLRDPDSEVDQQPDFARNPHRSMKEELLVLVGLCTHLGCSPKFVPEMTAQPFDSDWKGGFFCPCHNSRFDLAGRVFEGVPAPTNLEVPPYTFLDDDRLMIGVAPGGGAA